LRLIPLALGSWTLLSCADEPTHPTRSASTETTIPAGAVAANSWLIRKDMWSIERTALTAATVTDAAGRSVVYVIGGHSPDGGPLGKVMAYNVAANSWTVKASLPVPLWGMNQAAVLKGKIYVSGGCMVRACSYDPPSSRLYVFDPADNTWERKQEMPGIRDAEGVLLFSGMYGVTGVIAGQLYTLSSCNYGDAPLFYDCDPSLFFRYNPSTDRWTTLPRPKNSYRYGGVVDGKFYAIGGQVEVYDPATNRWTLKTDPAPALPSGAAMAVMLSRIHVIGGWGPDGQGGYGPLRTTRVYDPAADRWSNGASLPTGRNAIAAAKVFVAGQPRIEVIGGPRPGNNLQYVP
jgi:N-acetylneuraminic acid mutarotase